MPEETAGGGRPYVFISYKRDVEPDHTVAATVFQALRQQCEVFIDQVLPAGTNWGKQINEALHRTDCFIVFLSAESVASEMVGAEIETAYHLQREQNGRPLIIPVRLAYEALFPYPVSAYLHNLNWISWQRHEDTPHVLDHLNRAISDRSLVHTAPPTTSPEPS